MKRAIDIVIIPPKEIIDLVISINQKAVQNGTARIELGTTDRIPHLSLLMGVVDNTNLPLVIEKMKNIAEKFNAFELTVNEIKTQSFSFEKSEELQRLHEMCVAEIDSLLSHTIDNSYYQESDPSIIPETTINWPKNFIKKYSFDSYWPHITIHSPELYPVEIPFSFKASTFSIYHLGNKNTCRTKLAEFTLN